MEQFLIFPKSEAKFQHWPQNSFELRRFCGKVLSSVPIVSICTTILPLHIGTGCITGGKTEEQILNLPPSSTMWKKEEDPYSEPETHCQHLVSRQQQESLSRDLTSDPWSTVKHLSSLPHIQNSHLLLPHNSGMQADKSGTREPRIHRAHEIKRPSPIVS